MGEQIIRMDDVIAAQAGAGRIVTGWAVIAEAVNGDDAYEIVVITDGTSSPWKLEGLVNYALQNGYLTVDDDLDFDDIEDGEL
jgi:O-acetyl-ADP-ribose deacetylase (regulator of RNase III)